MSSTQNVNYNWRDINSLGLWRGFSIVTILQTYQNVLQNTLLPADPFPTSPPNTISTENPTGALRVALFPERRGQGQRFDTCAETYPFLALMKDNDPQRRTVPWPGTIQIFPPRSGYSTDDNPVRRIPPSVVRRLLEGIQDPDRQRSYFPLGPFQDTPSWMSFIACHQTEE
ncbi:hypothetical protein V8E54_006825 [Elaphomyces granulatus]